MRYSIHFFALLAAALFCFSGCASNSGSSESAGPSNVAAAGDSDRDAWVYDRNAPKKAEQVNASVAATDSNQSSQLTAEQKAAMKRYIIRPGDSLWKIAHLHKVSVDQIRETNQLTTDILQPGKVLLIPGPATKQSS